MKKLETGIVILVLAFGLSASCFATVPPWTITNSYSAAQNPNGVWSYGYRSSAEAADLTVYQFHNYWNFWSSTWETVPGESTEGVPHTALEAWHSSGIAWDGVEQFATSTSDCFAWNHRSVGDIEFSGGSGGATAAGVIRFTAPAPGRYSSVHRYSVAASFTQPDDRYTIGDPGALSTVYVLKNGVSQGSGTIQLYGDSYSFPATEMMLSANDTVEFAIVGAKPALVSGSITEIITSGTIFTFH